MMNNDTPDPFELIRQEARQAEPSEEDLRRARLRLEAAILGEQETPRPPVRRWLVPSVVAVILVIIVGGVAVLRPTPAEAALAEVAEAARQATALDIPPGSFIYTRSERVELAIRPGTEFGLDQQFVAYLLPSSREVWRQPTTEFVQIRTINHTPHFLDPEVEDAYYRLGLDATDRLGETQTEQFTGVADPLIEIDWPLETEALHAALREYAARGGDGRPEPVEVFDLATDLLREADLDPEFRAALVDVLARLPVDIVDRTNQTLTIEIAYTTPVDTRDAITLSSEGMLLAETSTVLAGDAEIGLPADTVVLMVEYLETRITDDL